MEAGYQGILELRRLHRQLDEAIRDAYGWGPVSGEPRAVSGEDRSQLAAHRSPIDLGHDFHEVETLPENDRVRYTLSPTARKEVLKRLLAENHRRAALEAAAAPDKPKAKRGRKAKPDDSHEDLFP